MPSPQIVRSKLQRPREIGDFVARSELLTLLEAGSSRPLTLLVAPAGYGKTALVAHWLAGRDGQTAWLSLDHDDSDPIVFIHYFAAALRTVVPDACAETLAHLDAVQQAPWTHLVGSLSNDLAALPAPLVLVLDNYQRIDSPPIHALLDRLLEHPASALHLLLIARNDPPLSLGALRVREEVNEIRMRDLQLGQRETASPARALYRTCHFGSRVGQTAGTVRGLAGWCSPGGACAAKQWRCRRERECFQWSCAASAAVLRRGGTCTAVRSHA
jgi:LuxR family maltose regulon positive regulatory protein